MFTLVDAPTIPAKRKATGLQDPSTRHRKLLNKSANIDKRTGRTWDVSEAFRTKLETGMPYRKLSKIYGVSPATLLQAFKPLQNLLKTVENSQAVQAFSTNKPRVLTAAQMILVDEMLKRGKLQKASVNNLAYAARQMWDMQRAEDGKSTAGNASISFKFNFGGEVQVDLAPEAEVVSDSEGNRLITHETEAD